ncbi:MAG TPA: NHL repeat-containing protein, partial [Acidimicrobiales bacterium]|nr:NHL repeat-containing protein [Acidimicrobiales bacterium]
MLSSPGSRSVRRIRAFAVAGTPVLVIGAVMLVVPALSGGTAAASVSAPVAVAGVPAFGIGTGQLGGVDSSFQSPTDIVIDSKGDLFVADSPNDRVIEYKPSSPTSYPEVGTVVAGTGAAGSGLNQLDYPTGLALDANGDLFIGDSFNNRVVEYAYNSATGAYASSGTVVAGTGTSGKGLNQLDDPEGIALDSKGDLFVADADNFRVEEFAYNSGTGTYASSATEAAGTGVSGSGNNQFDLPVSVAISSAGNLFVGDYGNARVMEFAYNSSSGTFASSGTDISGLPDPAGWLTFDQSGDLFASYGYLGYGGVLEFAYNSSAGTYATSGTQIAGADMVGPEGLAFNPAGDLFVGEQAETSDPSNTVFDCVLEFTYSSSTSTWSPLGTIMGQIGRTNGGISTIAVDSHNNLFVSDGVTNGSNPAGLIEFPFNSSTGTYLTTGSLISSTAPNAMAFDSNNDLFAAESSGVVEFPYSSAGYPASGLAVPGATQLATLTGVTGLAFDASNDLFVSDGNQVLKFSYNSSAGTWAASGTVVVTIKPGTLPSDYESFYTGVTGIALDTSGDLFVSNPTASAVQEFLLNTSNGTYATSGTTVAGTG